MHSGSIKKEKAFELRKQKKSYRQIAEEVGVSKSTVSYWFRAINWSRDIQDQLTKRAQKISQNRLKHLNNLKKIKYKKLYIQAEQEAKLEFSRIKKDSLFIAGTMIYWGEGDRQFKNGIVRVSNVDSRMLTLFKDFLVKVCGVDKQKIRGHTLIYPDLKSNECIDYWSKSIGLDLKAFYKPAVIKGRHKVNRLPYGVCSIGVNNKYLKKKILTWIDLLADEI